MLVENIKAVRTMLKKMEKLNKKRTKLYLAHESEIRKFYTNNQKCEDASEHRAT
jgi:hypothetical protein